MTAKKADGVSFITGKSTTGTQGSRAVTATKIIASASVECRNKYVVYYIYSADKKMRIEEPFVDTEVSITPQTVREIPDKHFR